LHERDAFRAVFSYGGTLYTLSDSEVRNLPAARKNVRDLLNEVISRLDKEIAA
jgi:chromosome partitioning protein